MGISGLSFCFVESIDSVTESVGVMVVQLCGLEAATADTVVEDFVLLNAGATSFGEVHSLEVFVTGLIKLAATVKLETRFWSV